MNRFILLTLFALLTSPLYAVDPPPLRKADAKRILEGMEFQDVNVITVHQGVNTKGTVAPIYATIVAFGRRDNKNQQIQQNVFHDEDYGWFYYEITEKAARIWNKDGYREIKQWGTW